MSKFNLMCCFFLSCQSVRTPVNQAVRVGSDFSGMGCFELAAERVAQVLGLETVNVFSCDTNKHCQFMLLNNHLPERFYPNITARDHYNAPEVDWYGAGFPCQPFSSAGLRLGVDDHKERGLLVASSLAFVEAKKPVLAMFENVAGIMQKNICPCLRLSSIRSSRLATAHSIGY